MRKEIIIIVGALIIGTAIYFKPAPESRIIIRNPVIESKEVIIERNELVLDLTDRENGICADMYKQGWDWGLQQVPLQVGIWRVIEDKSESEIKELLYDLIENWDI